MTGTQGHAQPGRLVPRYRKVFLVTPANTVTGGPEALHQLADAIRQRGGEAYVSYYRVGTPAHPLGVPAETPQPYRRYDAPQAAPEDESGNLVVFPEVQPLAARRFSRAATAIWWLSVDNFLLLNERPQWDELRRHVNFAQSHYAAEFLARNGIRSVPLTDYLNDDFLSPLRRTQYRNAIAYNIKSAPDVERLKQAAPKLTELTWIQLADLPHERVREILSGVGIYVDFGHHPGRDRMPREAALSGACVLTNRRGSAGSAEDVPLPRLYKLDHLDPGFAKNVARTIGVISATRPFHLWRQQRYRGFAAGGKAIFNDEVRRAFFQ